MKGWAGMRIQWLVPYSIWHNSHLWSGMAPSPRALWVHGWRTFSLPHSKPHATYQAPTYPGGTVWIVWWLVEAASPESGWSDSEAPPPAVFLSVLCSCVACETSHQSQPQFHFKSLQSAKCASDTGRHLAPETLCGLKRPPHNGSAESIRPLPPLNPLHRSSHASPEAQLPTVVRIGVICHPSIDCIELDAWHRRTDLSAYYYSHFICYFQRCRPKWRSWRNLKRSVTFPCLGPWSMCGIFISLPSRSGVC